MSKEESKKNPFEAAKVIKTEAPKPESVKAEDQPLINFVTAPVKPIPIPKTEDLIENQDGEEEETQEEEENLSPEAGSSDTPPQEDESDDNPYEYLANQLKSDGFIDDIEITKTISGKDVYEAYTAKLRKEIEPKVLQETQEKIQELGATEQDLILAMLMRKGVDIKSLQDEGVAYEQLSSFNKEASKESKILNIKRMHYAKGYSEEDSEALINNVTDEKLDTLYANSTNFFGDKYKEWVSTKTQLALAKEAREKEILERNVNLIKSKLNSLEIMGDKIDKQKAKELDSHFFIKDDIFETEDGRKIPATKFEKFFYKLMADPELKLLVYKDYLYKDKEVKDLEKKIEKEKEKEFLAGYKRSVTKNVKPNPSKNTVLPPKNSRTFMVEF